LINPFYRLPVDHKTAAYLLAWQKADKWNEGIQECVWQENNWLSKLPNEIKKTILSYAEKLLINATKAQGI
jgi:hypothetical protein